MVRIPVFYYHSIGNKGPETLAISQFREHLELMKTLGFSSITFSDLAAGSYDASRRNAVLTFDDGLLDNFENAYPVLQEFGYKATFFIIAGFDKVVRWVNPKTRNWSDTERKGYSIPFPSMQKHHRDELLDYGMEIGSHSFSHRKLNKISANELKAEIFDSKAKLEDQHGREIASFCYPKGRFNRAVLDLVDRAGYRGACTTIPAYFGRNTSRLECGRFLIKTTGLFEKILRLAVTESTIFDKLLMTVTPALKIKNAYL